MDMSCAARSLAVTEDDDCALRPAGEAAAGALHYFFSIFDGASFAARSIVPATPFGCVMSERSERVLHDRECS
jgi:hypothetical protein